MTEDLFTPKYAFLTSGVGEGEDFLVAFDGALREAGISSQNLVPVSSVFPPECKLVEKEEGIKMLKAGRISFCVMARLESNVANERISAGVGLIIPSNKEIYGYLSECKSSEKNKEEMETCAQDVAVKLLAAKLGMDTGSLEYEKRTSIAASAVVKEGNWSSVVASCVFIL